MRAFYHPDQALHDPKQFMRAGVLADPTDLPERTARLLSALAAHGITPERPADCGDAPLMKVHPAHYLTYLATAWDRWKAIPGAGPEALPNTSPYWSGRPDRDARPPCPSPHIVAETGYYLGDMAVALSAHTWTSARRAAQSAVAAADAVRESGGRAYALCRPSGHHCRADRASGFCYMNNSAIAAERLREHFDRVAVMDVDAHHGDGTQEIFYRRGDVLTVSTHADPDGYYPFYTGRSHETGHGAGEGANLNLPLPVGSDDSAFLAAVDQGVARVRSFGAQALVLALGYDAHKQDPLSALNVSTEAFRGIGARVAGLGIPLVVVQEGGYGIEVIGDCLKAFLEGLESA